MIKKENIYGIVILLILIANFNFVLAQEINKDIFSFDSEKVEHKVFSEDGKEITQLDFTEGGFAEIKGVRFENILPARESLNPSYIKIDALGNILEADLTANEKGSVFLINGLTFEAPPNSRVYYNEDGFYLENVEVSEIKKGQFVESTIKGKNINIFNELFLESGEISLQEERYLLQGGNFIYNKMQIRPQSFNKLLIEKNPSRDLSKFQDNFIQHTDSGLKIQTRSDAIGFDLSFLEGNELFDVQNTENKEGLLFMSISGGDKLEITKKDFLIKGMPPLIKHTFAEEGKTIIKNGRHIFKFEEGKYLSELGNLNAKNKLSVPFNLDSDILKD